MEQLPISELVGRIEDSIRKLEEKVEELNDKAENLGYEMSVRYKPIDSLHEVDISKINKEDEEKFLSMLDKSVCGLHESEYTNKNQLTLDRNGKIVSIHKKKLEMIDRDGYIVTSEVAKLYHKLLYDPHHYKESPEDTRWFLFDDYYMSRYSLKSTGDNKIILTKTRVLVKYISYLEEVRSACVRYLRPYMKEDRKFRITLGRRDKESEIRWYEEGSYAKGIYFEKIFSYKKDIRDYQFDAIMIEWDI